MTLTEPVSFTIVHRENATEESTLTLKSPPEPSKKPSVAFIGAFADVGPLSIKGNLAKVIAI